jgi:AcrR family transcriptional regulator
VSKNTTGRAGRILQAADELFCERGYAGVSVRDVAQRADVNKALVFYHYESKVLLFERVLQGYYEAHGTLLRSGIPREGDLKERVHGLVGAYFDFMAEHHRYARLIQQEVARQGEHLPLIRKNLAQLLLTSQETLGELLPERGPLAPKHFFLTLAGMTINYFTYAPALGEAWGEDPCGEAGVAERRAHVRWVVDAILGHLE